DGRDENRKVVPSRLDRQSGTHRTSNNLLLYAILPGTIRCSNRLEPLRGGVVRSCHGIAHLIAPLERLAAEICQRSAWFGGIARMEVGELRGWHIGKRTKGQAIAQCAIPRHRVKRAAPHDPLLTLPSRRLQRFAVPALDGQDETYRLGKAVLESPHDTAAFF